MLIFTHVENYGIWYKKEFLEHNLKCGILCIWGDNYEISWEAIRHKNSYVYFTKWIDEYI